MIRKWWKAIGDGLYLTRLSKRLDELATFAHNTGTRIDGRDLAQYLSIVVENRHLPEVVELVNVCSYRPSGKLTVVKGGPVEYRNGNH
jgi:hypothetical protein